MKNTLTKIYLNYGHPLFVEHTREEAKELIQAAEKDDSHYADFTRVFFVTKSREIETRKTISVNVKRILFIESK